MAAVDKVLNQMKAKHQEGADIPPDCLASFLCTKSSWRGKYRRIMRITPISIITQYPDTLAITNIWHFTPDSDIDAVTATPSDAEEPEFIISARTEKRVSNSLLAQAFCALFKCMRVLLDTFAQSLQRGARA